MFRWLTILCFRVRVLSALCGVPARVTWNKQDAANLKIFLRTQSGQRLLHLFRSQAMNVTVASVTSPIRYPTELARGHQESFSLFCKLSGIDPLQVVETGEVSLTDPKGTSDEEEEEIPANRLSRVDQLGSPIG